jgi:type II pantothenate kinase
VSTDLFEIPELTVGIDAGASLCKVVLHGKTLETARYSSADLDAVRSRVARWGPRRIAATGGGAADLGTEVAGVAVRHVAEFEAWGHGAPLLAARAGRALPAEYLLVSLGTGTSVLAVRRGEAARVGGTALGGGTLLGLGQALFGSSRFEDIAALARRGDRRRVDLLVGDIYRRGGISLPPDLNAASFGKLASPGGSAARPQDVAHALIGLVGENIALICGMLARQVGVADIVYCGSTLLENSALEDVLRTVSAMLGARASFLEGGAYCGAVGAAALAARS